jgi:hypothetical protein
MTAPDSLEVWRVLSGDGRGERRVNPCRCPVERTRSGLTHAHTEHTWHTCQAHQLPFTISALTVPKQHTRGQ